MRFLLLALLAVSNLAHAAVSAPSGVTVGPAVQTTTPYLQYTAPLRWNNDVSVTQWLIYINGNLAYSPYAGEVPLSGSLRTYTMTNLQASASPLAIAVRAVVPPNPASAFSSTVYLTITATPLDVYCTNCSGGSSSATITADTSTASATRNSTLAAIQAGLSGLTVSSSALPDGAATAALQTAGNATLTSILGEMSGVTVNPHAVTQGGPWTVSGSVGISSGLDSVTITSGSVLASLSQPANAVGTIAGNGQAVTVTAYGGNGGFMFQFSAGFTGTIVCDISFDGTTWSQVPFFYGNAAVFTQVISQANPATNSVVIPQNNGAKFCRLRASAYTSGTATIKGVPVSASLSPWLATQPASQSGTWTVQPGNTANTTPWLVQLAQTGAQAYSITSPAFVGGATYAGVVKASGAILGGIHVTSVTATADATTVVHFYNQTFTPTVGVGTNHLGRCVQVGPGTTDCDFGTQGVTITAGLAYTLTGGLPDTDSTVIPAAAAIIIEYR